MSGAGTNDLGLPERNCKLRPRIGGAQVGLAVETLVFEKQNRIVAADGRAQQSVGVEGVRREDNAQARNVREDAFARLRVINRSRR